jgi:putative oxidoreductase
MSLASRIVYHCCRLLLGGLFCYAGVVKVADVAAFAGQVANYQLLPYAWNFLVAATLPYVEMLAGVLLLLNTRVRSATVVLGGLTAAFMVLLLTVMARGLDIDCGCFRSAGHTTAAAAFVRDIGLLLLAVVVYRLRGRLPESRS